uniref:Pgd2 n=1 Tax=Arundo donax TaxID=35708 RepID=A0A0A9CP16_ARUDO
MALAPRACPLAWPTSTPTAGTGCPPTWCRRRGTTLVLTPMRGSTCLVLSTPSGSRLRVTPRTELLMLLHRWHPMARYDMAWYFIIFDCCAALSNQSFTTCRGGTVVKFDFSCAVLDLGQEVQQMFSILPV